MPKTTNLEWIDPLNLAYQISISNYQENWVFLYSGLSEEIQNSKSFLCLHPKKEIIADDFKQLEQALKNSDNKYFGYLGYGLKNSLENLAIDQDSFITFPNLWMINFDVIIEFDHNKKTAKQFCQNDQFSLSNLIKRNYQKKENELSIKSLKSNFSKAQYLQKVRKIQKHIENGDIYQANLTRKFFGYFNQKPKNPFEIFLKLNKASPANYSCFLKLGENFVISSSPELFLKIDQNGQVLSSPIKGTAKRFKDKKLDEESKNNLKNSPKEQAENLMIVDLVRNDFSKHCQAGSVKIDNLFKINSYKTIHHLSSDILGIKKSDANNIDIIKDCFPPGSMTGTPKIKAMEICSNLEKLRREIYSGAIGWVGKDCHLSVVIRTLIINKNKFEFQVGGAITYDSDPELEWMETINKAKAISKILKIAIVKEIDG